MIGFCTNCSHPEAHLTKRHATYDTARKHAPQWCCSDVVECERRASARARVRGFAREARPVTPPGMLLLALLRAAAGPLPIERATMGVRLLMANDGAVAGDVTHARASGLIVETSGLWVLGTGPRVDALLATMPEGGDIARAAADVLSIL